jgi:aminoglycoside 3-N-acetyltransferase
MKQIIKSLLPYLPVSVRSKISKKVTEKKIAAHRERKKRIIIQQDELKNIINKFDLAHDIIIHSSLSNIGKVEGGGGYVIELLLEKVNLEKNTLLAPALPYLGTTTEYLDTLELFDLTTAKNAMGNIPNQLMKKEGCLRSFHPTHSVIALGAKNFYYTNEHEKSKTPFGSTSPYYKITENEGKILMFGVGLNSITNFHVYEDLLAEHLPFKVYDDKEYKINSTNGLLHLDITTKVHNIHLSVKRDCERARKNLIANGYITTYTLGDSEVSLLDAKGLTITLLKMLVSGESIYGSVGLNATQKEFVNKKILELS